MLNRYDRSKDSEAKFFEYIKTLHSNKNDAFEITILSERNMCESCRGVFAQFTEEYPNAIVNVVSGRVMHKKKNRDDEEVEVEISPWDWRKRK